MPAAAYALLAAFTAVAAGSATVAVRIVGPWRPSGAVVPFIASFGALYVVGHRLRWTAGPTVPLFGFRVALGFDVVLALLAALAGAVVQRGVARLFQAEERSPGRDGGP